MDADRYETECDLRNHEYVMDITRGRHGNAFMKIRMSRNLDIFVTDANGDDWRIQDKKDEPVGLRCKCNSGMTVLEGTCRFDVNVYEGFVRARVWMKKDFDDVNCDDKDIIRYVSFRPCNDNDKIPPSITEAEEKLRKKIEMENHPEFDSIVGYDISPGIYRMPGTNIDIRLPSGPKLIISLYAAADEPIDELRYNLDDDGDNDWVIDNDNSEDETKNICRQKVYKVSKKIFEITVFPNWVLLKCLGADQKWWFRPRNLVFPVYDDRFKLLKLKTPDGDAAVCALLKRPVPPRRGAGGGGGMGGGGASALDPITFSDDDAEPAAKSQRIAAFNDTPR